MLRVDGRTNARLDALFAGGLVVELEGHGKHSSRQQRQADEARRGERLLKGLRVVVFTYNDVRDLPWWVVQRLRQLLALTA